MVVEGVGAVRRVVVRVGRGIGRIVSRGVVQGDDVVRRVVAVGAEHAVVAATGDVARGREDHEGQLSESAVWPHTAGDHANLLHRHGQRCAN